MSKERLMYVVLGIFSGPGRINSFHPRAERFRRCYRCPGPCRRRPDPGCQARHFSLRRLGSRCDLFNFGGSDRTRFPRLLLAGNGHGDPGARCRHRPGH